MDKIEEEFLKESKYIDKSFEKIKTIIKSKKEYISIKDASSLYDQYHYNIITLMLLCYFTGKKIDWASFLDYYKDKRNLSDE